MEIGSRTTQIAEMMIARGMNHIAIDADKHVIMPPMKGLIFINKAVTGDRNQKTATFVKNKNPYKNHLTRIGFRYDGKLTGCLETVETTSIEEIMMELGIAQLDAIMMDCEGAETIILRRMKNTMAKQICVEFHVKQGQPQSHVRMIQRCMRRAGYEERMQWVDDGNMNYCLFVAN